MIELILPFPDMKLSPNQAAYAHWGKVSKLRKKARTEAFFDTKGQIGPKLKYKRVRASYTFHQPDSRRRNHDNIIAAYKSYQDGVADAIGIPDENWEPEYKFGEIIKGGKVTLVISPLE